MLKWNRGYTLLEGLLVIAFIATLLITSPFSKMKSVLTNVNLNQIIIGMLKNKYESILTRNTYASTYDSSITFNGKGNINGARTILVSYNDKYYSFVLHLPGGHIEIQ